MSPRVVRLGSLADFAHGPASSFELSMVAASGLAEIREQRAAPQNSDENEQILKADALAQSPLNSVQSPSAAIRNAAVAAVPTLGTPRVLAAAPSAANPAVAKQDCYKGFGNTFDTPQQLDGGRGLAGTDHSAQQLLLGSMQKMNEDMQKTLIRQSEIADERVHTVVKAMQHSMTGSRKQLDIVPRDDYSFELLTAIENGECDYVLKVNSSAFRHVLPRKLTKLEMDNVQLLRKVERELWGPLDQIFGIFPRMEDVPENPADLTEDNFCREELEMIWEAHNLLWPVITNICPPELLDSIKMEVFKDDDTASWRPAFAAWQILRLRVVETSSYHEQTADELRTIDPMDESMFAFSWDRFCSYAWELNRYLPKRKKHENLDLLDTMTRRRSPSLMIDFCLDKLRDSYRLVGSDGNQLTLWHSYVGHSDHTVWGGNWNSFYAKVRFWAGTKPIRALLKQQLSTALALRKGKPLPVINWFGGDDSSAVQQQVDVVQGGPIYPSAPGTTGGGPGAHQSQARPNYQSQSQHSGQGLQGSAAQQLVPHDGSVPAKYYHPVTGELILDNTYRLYDAGLGHGPGKVGRDKNGEPLCAPQRLDKPQFLDRACFGCGGFHLPRACKTDRKDPQSYPPENERNTDWHEECSSWGHTCKESKYCPLNPDGVVGGKGKGAAGKGSGKGGKGSGKGGYTYRPAQQGAAAQPTPRIAQVAAAALQQEVVAAAAAQLQAVQQVNQATQSAAVVDKKEKKDAIQRLQAEIQDNKNKYNEEKKQLKAEVTHAQGNVKQLQSILGNAAKGAPVLQYQYPPGLGAGSAAQYTTGPGVAGSQQPMPMILHGAPGVNQVVTQKTDQQMGVPIQSAQQMGAPVHGAYFMGPLGQMSQRVQSSVHSSSHMPPAQELGGMFTGGQMSGHGSDGGLSYGGQSLSQVCTLPNSHSGHVQAPVKPLTAVLVRNNIPTSTALPTTIVQEVQPEMTVFELKINLSARFGSEQWSSRLQLLLLGRRGRADARELLDAERLGSICDAQGHPLTGDSYIDMFKRGTQGLLGEGMLTATVGTHPALMDHLEQQPLCSAASALVVEVLQRCSELPLGPSAVHQGMGQYCVHQILYSAWDCVKQSDVVWLVQGVLGGGPLHGLVQRIQHVSTHQRDEMQCWDTEVRSIYTDYDKAVQFGWLSPVLDGSQVLGLTLQQCTGDLSTQLDAHTRQQILRVYAVVSYWMHRWQLLGDLLDAGALDSVFVEAQTPTVGSQIQMDVQRLLLSVSLSYMLMFYGRNTEVFTDWSRERTAPLGLVMLVQTLMVTAGCGAEAGRRQMAVLEDGELLALPSGVLTVASVHTATGLMGDLGGMGALELVASMLRSQCTVPGLREIQPRVHAGLTTGDDGHVDRRDLSVKLLDRVVSESSLGQRCRSS